jgi:hypothetical protein
MNSLENPLGLSRRRARNFLKKTLSGGLEKRAGQGVYTNQGDRRLWLAKPDFEFSDPLNINEKRAL